MDKSTVLRNYFSIVLFVIILVPLFPAVYSLNESTEIINSTTDDSPIIVDADHYNLTLESLSSLKVSPSLSSSTTENPPTKTTVTTTTMKPNTSTSKTTTTSTSSTTTTTSSPSTTTTTTTTTKKTTVKPSKATTVKPRKRESRNNRRVCSCDLHMKSCDLNCCCDVDCKKEEREVFSFCLDSEFYDPYVSAHNSHNSHSCFRSQIFYRENSPYYIEEADRGMFCVVTDNVQHADQLEQEPKTVDAKFLAKKKPKFSWEYMKEKQPEIVWQPYTYGSNLLQLKTKRAASDSKVTPFGIPSSLFGKECTAVEYLKFLQPAHTKCVVKITNMKIACMKESQLDVSSFIEHTSFLINPSLFSIPMNLAPLVTATCTSFRNGSRLCQMTSSFKKPSWNSVTESCHNVLENLELTFIHSGVEGLSKVIAKAQFGSYSLKTKGVKQEFSTTFFWRPINTDDSTGESEESNSTKIIDIDDEDILVQDEKDTQLLDWPRSGNPGYIFGKPVVMGIMQLSETDKDDSESDGIDKIELSQDNESDDEESPENVGGNKRGEKGKTTPAPEKLGVTVDRNPKGWMTIHGPGNCKGENETRKNVLFGIGHQSECNINVKDYKTCENLQNEIIKILLGVSPEDFVQRYVAAFGNPDLDDFNDWVSVNIPGFPTTGTQETVHRGCDGIVSTLKIKIAYAFVGPVKFPQAKIIGVLYEFGESFNIPQSLRCSSSNDIDKKSCLAYEHQVRVTTTVIFMDTTKAPVPTIGQWPVVSIKLPQDFFYPFSTTSGSYVISESQFLLKLYLFSFVSLIYNYYPFLV